MAFATLNGLTVHYELIGNPKSKKMIVFANALGTDFRIWLPVFDEMSDDMSFLLYDMRGHGLTSLPEGAFSIDTLADDLIALTEHLEFKKSIFCGLSVGGLVVQALALKRPDLVRKLILSNTAAKVGDTDTWNARIEAVRKGGLASISGSVMTRWFTEDFRESRAADVDGYRLMLERQSVEGYVRTAEAIRDADYRAGVKDMVLPVLCLAGDRDQSVPAAIVQDTADIIEGSAFEVIEQCGHMPSIEQPEQLAALIEDFIRQN
nr:3-oxoadipate enol-lactonase [uncultured Gellertiella sp.]